MTPGEAIRMFCIECIGSVYDVKDCGGDHCLNGGCDDNAVCWFWKYRMGSGRPSVRLIRKFCLYCMSDSHEFVHSCWTPDCPLHKFRMGTNPARKGQGDISRMLRKAV